MINWKIRFKNKQFWIYLVSVFLLIIQIFCFIFGYKIDINKLSSLLLMLIDSIFSLLVITGICIDPTTKGLSDSKKALLYDEPKH